MIADLPNPLAKARDEFMLSREACYLCDPTSIGAPAHCGLYLQDRIEAAFLAGWNACEAAQPVQPALSTTDAMRLALAYVRWQAFGECRTAGRDGPPPTASDVEEALMAALRRLKDCPVIHCTNAAPNKGEQP